MKKHKSKKNSNKKILILVPQVSAQGGISNYYRTLKQYFSNNIYYFVRGARTFPFRKNAFAELFRFISDILKFIFQINFKGYSLVQTTTAFTPNSIIRDGIFIWLTKLFKKKLIVYFRGWNHTYANNLTNKNLRLFKKIYFKADAIIDLANENILKLKEWGYNGECFLETTTVDENLIKSINEDFILKKLNSNTNSLTILFLARVEREKGIYETIEAYQIVKQKFKEINLIIAGDGLELAKVRNKVEANQIQGVTFTGFITGAEKTKVFKDSSIYILPSYREGMPGSVLEAMAFGLPVVTSNVGGLPDIFENNLNGYITPNIEPKILADLLLKLITNQNLMKTISIHNFQYAKSKFLSKIVVKRVEGIFNKVLNNV